MSIVVTDEDLDDVALLEQGWGFPFHPRFRKSLAQAIAAARTRGEATGAEREMITKRLVALLCEATYNLWTSTLVGNRAPVNDQLNAKLREPRIGDMVMERSTFWYPDRDEHRIGYLRRIEDRPRVDADEWERESPGEPVPTERHWIIEPILNPGTEYAWHNADFIRVLDHAHGTFSRCGHRTKPCEHSIYMSFEEKTDPEVAAARRAAQPEKAPG